MNFALFIHFNKKTRIAFVSTNALLGYAQTHFIITICIIQVLFRLCRSDIIAFSAIVLLKPYGFSVILFAKLGVAEYHDAKHHITAKQYHSPNIFGE